MTSFCGIRTYQFLVWDPEHEAHHKGFSQKEENQKGENSFAVVVHSVKSHFQDYWNVAPSLTRREQCRQRFNPRCVVSVCKLAPVVCVHEKNERSRGNEQAHPHLASERIGCLIPKRQSFPRVESLNHDAYICEAS